MKFAIFISILSIVACQSVNQEDVGACLEWRTMMVEKKERLPYPMQGVIVREEQITYCAIREEMNNA